MKMEIQMEPYLGSVIGLDEYRDFDLKDGKLVEGESCSFLTLRLKNSRGQWHDFKVKVSPDIMAFLHVEPEKLGPAGARLAPILER
jgi:hypothetical protein